MEAYLHFCVRKSISKRKQRFYTKSIKITISCINSFLVLFSFKLAIKIAVFLCTRIILIPSGPCCSQLAAWSYLSQKDIGEGKSASLSKLGNIQNSTDIFCFFQNICQFYRTTGIQDKYCRNLLCIKEPDILPLPSAQIIISLDPAPILSLTGNPAYHIDCCLGIDSIFCCDCTAFRHCKGIFRIGIKRIFHKLCFFQYFFFPCPACFCVY